MPVFSKRHGTFFVPDFTSKGAGWCGDEVAVYLKTALTGDYSIGSIPEKMRPTLSVTTTLLPGVKVTGMVERLASLGIAAKRKSLREQREGDVLAWLTAATQYTPVALFIRNKFERVPLRLHWVALCGFDKSNYRTMANIYDDRVPGSAHNPKQAIGNCQWPTSRVLKLLNVRGNYVVVLPMINDVTRRL